MPNAKLQVFVKAKFISKINNCVTYQIDNTELLSTNNLVLERATNIISTGYNDMINMEVLNDAELLANLLNRFNQDEIFTFVGPTLLILNPFKNLSHKFS